MRPGPCGPGFIMIQRLFATPIYHTNLNDDELRRSVKALILSRRNDAHRHRQPPQGRHPGVFESRFDFLDSADKIVMALRTVLSTHLQAFLAVVLEAEPGAIPMGRLKSHSWFHITSTGGYFRAHNHPNASWSLVYCVDNGHEARGSEEEQSGHLVFSDPRFGAAMYLDRFNRRQHRDVSFDGAKYFLQHDDLLIFPSFVQHQVEPYCGNSQRITVAANFWADIEYG